MIIEFLGQWKILFNNRPKCFMNLIPINTYMKENYSLEMDPQNEAQH
jgi:hypothetical protein